MKTPLEFVAKVANLKKWGEPDSDMGGEPFEPSVGVDDSHECLMDLIEEARELSLSPIFIVTGRIPGEDDDTIKVFRADGEIAALLAFEAAMYDEANDDRDLIKSKWGDTIFITNSLMLDSAIIIQAGDEEELRQSLAAA
jgi:hypothetical protein